MVDEPQVRHRKFRELWNQAVDSNPYRKLMEELFIPDIWENQLIQWEWDNFMERRLPKLRSSDPLTDYHIACLIYYNEEISQEEEGRRLEMLEREMVSQAYNDCNALRTAPMQEVWRRKRKSHPGFPKEWKHVIRDSWEDRQDALKDLLNWTMGKRRKDFTAYYQQARQDWEERLTSAIEDWAERNAKFRQCRYRTLVKDGEDYKAWKRSWRREMLNKVDHRAEQGGLLGMQLKEAFMRTQEEGASSETQLAAYLKIQECEKFTVRDVQEIISFHEKMNQRMEKKAKFNAEAWNWLFKGEGIRSKY
jgi:hypothetical protein